MELMMGDAGCDLNGRLYNVTEQEIWIVAIPVGYQQTRHHLADKHTPNSYRVRRNELYFYGL